MYNSENSIAIKLGVDKNPDSIKIIYFIKALVLIVHFFIYTVNRFNSALKLIFDFVLRQPLFNSVGSFFKKIFIFTETLFGVLPYLLKTDRIKVLKRKLFKLLLYALDTKSVGKRSIYMHRLQGNQTLFFRSTVIESTHVMETICKFNKYYSQILRHGKEHFPQVFNALFLLCLEGDMNELCYPVDNVSNLRTELFSDKR